MENLKYLKFRVDGQNLKRAGSFYDYFIVQGSENFLALQFEFNEDWCGAQTVVNFNNGADYEPINEGVCLIPASVLESMSFTFSVIGVTGDVTITTNSITLTQEEG